MNVEKLKYYFLKNTPKFIYQSIYFIWINGVKPIYSLPNYFLLKNFKGEILKTVNTSGVSFKIYIKKENGRVDQDIYLNGVFEPYFLSVIKENLEPGNTYVDIGGNIGQHSLFASQVVGGSGNVVAFEPIKKLYEQFKRSIEANGFSNIELYNAGCGEEEKEVQIYFMEGNMGASSIVANERVNGGETIKILVPDRVLENKDRIDFIKIDVEGYEYHVLQGLQETILKHHPKFLIEYTPSYYEKGDATHSEKIINYFLERGYQIYDLEKNRSIKDFSMINLNPKNPMENNTNFLCTYPH